MKIEQQEKEAARAFLKFFKDRFYGKIDPSEYALSYSGGKDSHLLYWIIKEYLREDRVMVVGVNTGFELPEIRDRILKNCDIVLHPGMNRYDVKEKYGIPCFSKKQDDYVYRYQHGSRSENTMKVILGKNPMINLNKKARTLLLEGRLHKVSHRCCLKTKEEPLMKWQKANSKKAIIGVRRAESIGRRAAYHTCMKDNGDFTPLYDWTDAMVDLIYRVYDIEIPKCYQYLSRTGCGGCPYGRNTELELSMLPRLQRLNAIKYFKESYDALGVDYRNIQSLIGYEEY